MPDRRARLRRRLWLGLAGVGGLAVALSAWGWWLAAPAAIEHPGLAPGGVAPGRVAAARPGRAGDARLVAEARRRMSGPREEACGDYVLVTDLDAGDPAALCRRVVARLDAVYERYSGVHPVGPAAGTVLLFASAAAFRGFVAADGRLALGYAGFSDPSRGIVAIDASVPAARLPATLAHELTHLVHRRAFGRSLPPWLSEGLADAIAARAGPGGLASPPPGLEPGPRAERLRGAYALGRARSLEELVRLERGGFDRDPGAVDYELSALLVGHLLADGRLAPRLRRDLRRVAAGEPYDPARLAASLGLGWPELEGRFREWLGVAVA